MTNLSPIVSVFKALRMSLQEEQARQQAAAASSSSSATAATSTSTAAALEPVPEGVNTQITDPTPATEPTGAQLTSAKEPSGNERLVKEENEVQMLNTGDEGHDEDEDEELRRALELSQQEGEGVEVEDVDMGEDAGMDHDAEDDEDEDIARASKFLPSFS